MTQANIEYFRSNKGPGADEVSLVSGENRNRVANFPGFANYHFESAPGWHLFGVSVRHSPLENGPAKVFIYNVKEQIEVEISEVAEGKRVVFYPARKSRETNFPRLEVLHGEVVDKPQTIDVWEFLKDRFYAE